jgi:hypothetical protein
MAPRGICNSSGSTFVGHAGEPACRPIAGDNIATGVISSAAIAGA